MNVKPLFDYLVVDAKEKQETTKSGFILTSASSDKYTTAKVLAVGVGGNLYGKELKIEFLDYIRETVKFGSIDELKAQLQKDLDGIKG